MSFADRLKQMKEQRNAAQPRTRPQFPVFGARLPLKISPLTAKLVDERGTGRISRHAIARGIETMADYEVEGRRFGGGQEGGLNPAAGSSGTGFRIPPPQKDSIVPEFLTK